MVSEVLLPQGCKGIPSNGDYPDPDNLEASIIQVLCDTMEEKVTEGDRVKILLTLKR